VRWSSCGFLLASSYMQHTAGQWDALVWGTVIDFGMICVCVCEVKNSVNRLLLFKATIRPGFSGTVPIFNDVSWKKSQFSRDAHLSRFGLVSWICPDLPISAAICLRIGGQKLAQIYLYIGKIAGGWGLALDHTGATHDAPPSQTPDSSHL